MLAFLGLLAFGCNSKPEFLFEKLEASQTRIEFQNLNSETETDNIFTFEYFYNGGGVAVGDINNDGLPDIYFSANQGENKLYLNKGNFHFEDITPSAKVAAKAGWKTGVAMVDVNQDGWLDIYVCRSKAPDPENRKNLLFINNGNLTFSEQGKKFGLDDSSYSTQAVFFDIDRDEDLDVFIVNHSSVAVSNAYKIQKGNTNNDQPMPYVSNKLLLNNRGSFRDASLEYGVFQSTSNFGLGAVAADINNDGWQDLYVSCDYTGSDKLYLNKKGAFLLDATDSLLSHVSLFSMGLDIADINNDGFLDILTLDMLPPDNARQKQLFVPDRYEVFQNMVGNGLHYQYMRNMLHLNLGVSGFSEIGQLAGISATDWSWAPLAADFDNDGLTDVFITNSFKRDFTNNDFIRYRASEQLKAHLKKKQPLYSTLLAKMPAHRFKNAAFKNEGSLLFSNQTIAWGLDHFSTSNGAVYSDLDLDGDLDLITNNLNEKAGIYRNNANAMNTNRWIGFQFDRKNAPVLGTRVTLFSQGNKLVREVTPSRGFQSSIENKVHFGLGTLQSVDSILVRWPNGKEHRLSDYSINKLNTIVENISSPKYESPHVLQTIFQGVSTSITYAHKENEFIDFKIQPLLPRQFSREGPALAVADVNNDGANDYYFGGASGQVGELWLSASKGMFIKSSSELELDKASEDVDAVFFDADNDADLDLYVVSGGYEFNTTDKNLHDRLYLNNGTGYFKKSVLALPPMAISGSCVRPADIDKDGDLDLFVGGRLIPGQYPEAASSKILLNDGSGKFSDATQSINPKFNSLGLVTDAFWVDLNKDGLPDLITCGEWTSIDFFINENGKLVNQSASYLQKPLYGWWNCLAEADLDNDGDVDFVAGNLGLNHQMKRTDLSPVTLTFADFDENGSVDPVLSYVIQDKAYPYPTRDELAEQIPIVKKKFTDFQSYSGATLATIFSQSKLAKARVLSANWFQTTVFINHDNKYFEPVAMPIEAQVAPVFDIAIADVNFDSRPDIITAGNLSGTRVRSGKLTGNQGFIFLNGGSGAFTLMAPSVSGMTSINADVRKLNFSRGVLVRAINDGPPEFYKHLKPHTP